MKNILDTDITKVADPLPPMPEITYIEVVGQQQLDIAMLRARVRQLEEIVRGNNTPQQPGESNGSV